MNTFQTQRQPGQGSGRPEGRTSSGPTLAVSDRMKLHAGKIAFGGNRLAADLFDGLASAIAEEIASQPKDECNKSTQIRRFYDELVGWEQKLVDEKSFQDNEAFFRMLKAKVAYAFGRGRDERKGKVGLVDDNFRHWFCQCVDETKSAESLKHFRLHFEAVLGFLKALRG